ncbi:hypothetical protein FHX74_001721 [Friedmanniella endophytica]|uniref:Glyoxalase-like domain-containing protein n=1 Tax=Microlunatus kandeliicorticis TaxID=1759536 RepID=A0A7W3P5L6_9ACTN|nr:VOC family protein [Microlunatus kandeliicorticis]MBA8794116.1 hypothetical protein [Microlunatus kandeliicorticis]
MTSTLRLESIRFATVDAPSAAAFWAGLLAREVHADADGLLLPGDRGQVGLRFAPALAAPANRPWLHLHVTSRSLEHQQQLVETALGLGGRRLDVGQGPEDRFVVLADPGGNELCFIEPGNRFLAGTGPLGEVTCEGTPRVGRFWHEALDWLLVWDEGEQTAIQSPEGGTKISWDGEGWEGRSSGGERRRQRFVLVGSEPEREIARLLGLGATRSGEDPTELADPDGNLVTLRAG